MKARKQYGIAVFHNIGDVLCCTPIAKQLKVDDPDCIVTYFTSQVGEVAVRHNPFIDEIVVLPGDQYELDRELPALSQLKPWTRFFTPAAYLNYDAIPGGSIMQPKGTIFGIVKAGARLNWTIPFGSFPFRLTDEEVLHARNFWSRLPKGRKILVETNYRSEQSPWTDEWNFDMLEAFKDLDPVFVFTARKRPEFLDSFLRRYPKATWCDLPFRLNAELFNLCDAFVGVSSGVSCLTYSDYCRNDVPRIEVTRGEHWGAAELPHHEQLLLCYTRDKYLEALQSVRCMLTGSIGEPVFSRRYDPESRFQGACPSCAARGVSGLRSEDIMQCRMCGAIYSVARGFRPIERLTVELVGAETLSSSASEFLDAVIEPSSYRVGYLLGEFGSTQQPREILEKVQYALRPGGTLELSVPNFDGVVASAGPGWSEMKPLSNLWYFSPRFLRELLIQAGFVVDEWGTDSSGKNKEPFLAALAKARPELYGEALSRFADEVNRRGGGDMIVIRATKRGGFKGRVRAAQAPLAKRIEPALTFQVQSEPLVSVIIPCHNHGRYLAEAVESVVSQTYRNREIILVDDGSTDGSSEIVERIAAERPNSRIRAVRIEHSGVEEARDTGAALAIGEWLIALDSDDRMLPQFVERALEALKSTPNAELVYGQQQQFGIGDRLWDPGEFSSEAIVAGRPMPSAAMVKRSFWLGCGGYNTGSPLNLSEHHLWLSAVEQSKSAAYLPQPLLEFRVERSGQIHHMTNSRFKLARALIRTLHPKLFVDSAMEAEYRIIAETGAELFDEISAKLKRYPRLWGPYFWRGLIAEQHGMFEQAQSDYDAAQLRR